MYTMYIIELALLLGGGFLCLRGLKAYKVIHMILCGLAGGYIGLHLSYSIGQEKLYFIALILTAVGAFIGLKYYKASLFVIASACSFLVVFSYFWNKATAIVKSESGGVLELKEVIRTSTEGRTSVKDLGRILNSFMSLQSKNTSLIAKTAADTVRQGLIIAVLVGVIVGILTLWFGDLIIMIFTAAFGALLLVYLIELFLVLNATVHLCAIIILALTGLFMQSKYCK